jgi:tryptophan-rich sensory protein
MSNGGANRAAPILTAFAAAVVVAALGAFLTELGPWYRGLNFPSWKPPDWLFGPAWTLIFACAAVAGSIGWRRSRDASFRTRLVLLFALNGALNITWSVLFFRAHRPDLALYEVGFLWLSILLPMLQLRSVSALAAWLLVPYLVWVSFASALNLAIVRLNAPFA